MATKLKDTKRVEMVDRTSPRWAGSDGNFFADLKEAQVEIGIVKASPLSARMISERAVRRLRLKIGS